MELFFMVIITMKKKKKRTMDEIESYRSAVKDLVKQLDEKNILIEKLQKEISRLKDIEIEYGKLKVQYLEQINDLLKIFVEASMLKR